MTYRSQSCFRLSKNITRSNSNIINLIKQTLKDIILIFCHDILALDKNIQERKQLCGKAWENDNDYLQVDRFTKIGEGRWTIGICNKITSECTPETNCF